MRGLWRTPVLGSAIHALWMADARRKRDWIAPHLSVDDRLLDVGSGPGTVLSVMREAGFQIDGLDIRDASCREDVRPILYAGGRTPFADKSYDAALLLTMLHHTTDPDAILVEATRIAKRVLVIEDIYTSGFQRRLTKVADSVTNLEFFGHPHTNRDDASWRMAFQRLGFKLIHASQKPYAGAF
ncbi:MAG: class I SAM-dependent methyltransferase, partial [Pseudomonadota bacterium]